MGSGAETRVIKLGNKHVYLLSDFINSATTFFNKSIVQFSKISFVDKSIVSQYEQRQPREGAAAIWDPVCGETVPIQDTAGIRGSGFRLLQAR